MYRFIKVTAPFGLLLTSCDTLGTGDMYPGGHMGYYSFGGWIASIMWIVLIGLLGVVVYTMIRNSGGASGVIRGGTTNETPLDILKRRYASGEISREQFESMKKDVES